MPKEKAGAKKPSKAAAEREFFATLDNRARYCQELLSIRTETGDVVPFRFNAVQVKLEAAKQAAIAAGRRPKFLILKARRQGLTTAEVGGCFHHTASAANKTAVTLAHTSDAAEKIFRIANMMYERLPKAWRPHRLTASNKRELNYPKLGSIYGVGTAGSRGYGRGDTITKAHWTEVAWSPGSAADQRDLLAGLSEACKGGEISLETTANGVGGMFYTLWKETADGNTEWTGIFFRWWDDPSFRQPFRADAEKAAFIASMTDEERALVSQWGLSPDQLAWRRAKKAELKELFLQEYPEDPETCFVVTGECFFDRAKLTAILAHIKDPLEVRDNGAIEIYERPIAGHRYAGGADVAEGLPNGDFCQLSILDVETRNQIARLRGRWKPEDFARRSADLCKEYNWALMAVERNNHGHSMLNTLLNQIAYPNLYYHLEYDAGAGAHKRVLGFPTTTKTRPIALDALRHGIEDGEMLVRDRVLIGECRTFVPNESGKYEAKSGCHDDAVLSWAIATQACTAALSGQAVVPEGGDSIVFGQGDRVFPPLGGRLF